MVDSVVIKADPTPAEGPNDAAMAAAYENQGQAPASPETPADEAPSNTAERPQWLPEKFKSPEDLAKAYSELEKKLGQAKQDEAPKGNEPPKIEAGEGEGETNTPDILNFDKYTAEFTQSGELSEESLKELAAKGISKDMVDAYIEGQKAIAERHLNTLYETAGGKDSLELAIKWAAVNMAPADIEAFNATMDSGNLSQMKLAVAGLMASYKSANGSEGKRVNGSGSASGASDVYGDMSEVVRDMGSKEYKESESFRQMVAAKLARSNVI